MVRQILEWVDDKYETEVVNGPDEPKTLVKAFGLGAIEGAIDGLTIGGVMLLAIGAIGAIASKTNKQ